MHEWAAMMHRTVLGLVVACAVVACKDGDDGDVDGAAQGWRAASLAMDEGQDEFVAQVEMGAEGQITATCPDGGEVSIDGRMEDLTIFALNVAFDGCQSDGVQVDGEVSFNATVMTTDTSAEVRFEYTGQLEFTGDVELSCTIDAVGRVAAETSGNRASAEVSFSGRICGADANAVVRASSR
jgi:hypothetical protein